MHQLPSDVLLNVFKQMNSKDMVLDMQVCKEWADVVDGNRSLYRRLVLPKKEGGWKLSILQLFDKRSESRLEEVSMEVSPVNMNYTKALGLVKTLAKSKDTLRSICIYHSDFEFSSSLKSNLVELSLKLPKITSLRIIDTPYRQPIHFRSRMFPSNEMANQEDAVKFRILWGARPASLRESLEVSPLRLNNLVSLKVESLVDPSELNTILRQFARTLKQLGIKVDDSGSAWITPAALPKVDFPMLQVLDVYCGSLRFPSWLMCPTLSTLIIRNKSFLQGTPAVSKLSVAGIQDFSLLIRTFSALDEVRIECTLQDMEGVAGEVHWKEFSETLRHRRRFSNLVRDSGGVSRMLIKKVVFPFELLDEEKLAELKDMADEVIDLDVAPKFVEIQI